ncbi:MAG: hypothetical protein WCR97_03895 [Bacilli bacterium]
MKFYKNKADCHVRRYKKSNHPTAIVGESKNQFTYKKLSHEQYRNELQKLNFNPNPRDIKNAYIGKKSRVDNKKFFDKKKSKWVFNKSDYDKL